MPPSPLATLTSTTSPDRHVRAWARLAPAGLTVVGFGASLIGEATLRKGRGEAYVLYGTAALCVFNAGLCLFGEAVKHRALADWSAETVAAARLEAR